MEISKISPGALKEKELLEKLSLEISRDFSISKKLAKKLIYKTHLSLDDLKNDIKIDNSENKESIIGDRKFNEKRLEKLLFSIKGAKEIIEKLSKTEISELKKLLDRNNTLIFEDNIILNKIFGVKITNKAQNPKNISDQIMGISLGITNSTIIITDVLYNLGKGIIASLPDLISIISGRGEIDSIKKV